MAAKIFSKMMKNAFFHLQSSLSYFALTFLVMQKKGLIRKLRFISKFIMLCTVEQPFTIYLLQKISRNNDNWTIKFGQLIEYNMRNIFSENSNQKCGGETISRPFSKKSKLSISLDKHPEILNAVCFHCMPQSMTTKLY